MCSIANEPEYFFSTRQAVQLAKKLNVIDVVGRAIDQLYDDRKVDAATQKQLHAITYAPLKGAVEEGFKQPDVRIEYGTPNYEMLKNLQYNASVFAAFKSHAQVKETAALLKDESGNLRSREDFKREAWKVDSKYREQYLNTEYDTAVRTSRMAAIWAKAQETKKFYPNFKYLESRSAIQRNDHKKYYGIILPIENPFWDYKFPPNGWGCKCGVEVSDDDVTDVPDGLPEPEKGFEFNSGKTGQVFDLANSHYIKSVPPAQQPALIRDAKKVVDAEAAEAAPYIPLYENKKTGAKVLAHPLAMDNGDYKQCLTAARELANWEQGPKKIEILPDLVDPALRAKLLPDAKGTRNPDYRIDGKTADLKTPSKAEAGSNTIQNTISKAHKQGAGAVIVLNAENYISEEQLYRDINKKLMHPTYQDFFLYLKYQDEWQYFTYDSWKSFYKTKPGQ